MDPAWASLVGALGGAVIGFSGALKVNADQRREGVRVERQQAFASYLGALYPAVAELREMPPNQESLALRISELFTSEAQAFIATRERLAAMGGHFFTRLNRLAAALAVVQVLDMPAEVEEVIEQANEYVERLGEERTPQSIEEWTLIKGRLHRAADLLKKEQPSSWRRLMP